VLREGKVLAGDEITQVSASPGSETITEMVRAVNKGQP